MAKGIPYGTILVASVAILGGYVYYDSNSALNKFGKEFTERLCDKMLPQTQDVPPAASPTASPTSEAVPQKNIKLSRESTYNPKVVNGAVYDAKKAMDARY